MKAAYIQSPVEYDPAIALMLEDIYSICATPGRLDRDPLALVAAYPDVRDREVAGLVASVLAFGSVDLILGACRVALAPLGDHPATVLAAMDSGDIAGIWKDFQYRFMFSKDMIALLEGIRRVLARWESLEAYFCDRDPGGEDIRIAAGNFVRGIRDLGGGKLRSNLLPDPENGSACKRLFLYLRWMARKDAIDPGGWERVDPARLIVPLDTHMFATCRDTLHFLGQHEEAGARGRGGKGPVQGSADSAARATRLPAPDMRAALRVTEAFRLYSPDDPVKYDFSLTRPGIDPQPGDERFGCH